MRFLLHVVLLSLLLLDGRSIYRYDRHMRKTAVLLLVIFIFPLSYIFASTESARKDYIFQFDIYRQKYSEFQVSKNEYAKFKTLTAQATALDKTKSMLGQRDQLLHAYLTLLAEKLAEDQGLPSTTKQLYVTLISNELKFLETHAQTIQSIATLEDATRVSEELSGHYRVLQISIRQILTGLSLGQLSILGNMYDASLRDAQLVMSTYRGTFLPSKQETINRWILQINNKRSFYQQKLDAIASLNAQLDAPDLDELDRKFSEITQKIAEARQYLVEGASFLVELKNALKYKE